MVGPNIPYNLFGLQLTGKQFEDYLQRSQYHDVLHYVATRVFFVDQLRYHAFFRLNPVLMDGLTSWRLGNEKIALQLYLLCTCVDALAGNNYIDFPSWLAKLSENGIDEQKISQILNQSPGNLSDPTMFGSAVLRIYQEMYLPVYGVKNNFLNFFSDLPPGTQRLLAQVYVISNPLSKSEISRDLNASQTLPRDIESWNQAQSDWQTIDLHSKTKLIAEYFYNYYRNPYTHKALSPKPRTTIDWKGTLPDIEVDLPNNAWDPIGDIIPYGKKFKIRRFWGKPYEDEVFILRLIVAIGWRQKAGIPVDGDLTEKYRTFQMRNETLHYAMYGLEELNLIQKQYLGEIQNEEFIGRVSLPKFSLQYPLLLKQYLNDSTLEGGLKNMIDNLNTEISSVNQVIDDFNKKYNLVFPNTLNIQMDPSYRVVILSEKDKEIKKIRGLLSGSSIEKTIAKLYEWFDQLADRINE
jgi:hypothetical protein